MSTPSQPASQKDLKPQHDALLADYTALTKLSLSLDITRGKPGSDQLDLSNDMLSLPHGDYRDAEGTDCRNYGGLDGLPAMKQLFADILNVKPGQVIVGGNSSLTMMHDVLARACLFGVVGSDAPWASLSERKFLCPSPGYDRHFTITEHLGFELVQVDMDENGPDMDQVEQLVRDDASIKGIWCVPRYSNPTGVTYGAETVRRLAEMNCAAADFRIMWDNAYAEHHLSDELQPLENILEHCQNAGNPNRVIEFASTSKMSLAGAGVSAMAASEENLADQRKHLSAQSIGPDKINQLRHLMKFPHLAALRTHMMNQKKLIKPKFDLVDEILTEQLGDLGIASWTRPQGGYFISLDIPEGCAARVIQLADDAGVKLTSAGAPYPYGKDPLDRNIRIAPTFPSLDDIRQATEVLATCVKLAVSEI